MSGRAEDPLLKGFAEASGGGVRSLDGVVESTAELVNSLMQSAAPQFPGTVAPSSSIGAAATAASGIYGDSASSPGANTQGLPLSSDESGGTAGAVESAASTFFESGFGMAAVVKGLIGLFGGGGTTQQPLEKYDMPSPIDFESAVSGTGLSAGSYNQTGAMRPIGPDTNGGAPTGSGGGSAAPQITVNVQAMDAQSLLDHSSEIAQAVRGAMLSMSSINDVVNEL